MSVPAIEPLASSPPFRSDQTFRSWTSALASSHHASSAAEFMQWLGLSKSAAFRPSWADLNELSRVTNEDPDQLQLGMLSKQRHSTKLAKLGGQLVDAHTNVPYRVCCACIAEDIDFGNVVNPERSAFERREWIPPGTTRCHRHNMPLIELGSPARDDFAALIRTHLTDFERALVVAGYQDTLGEYLSARLSGAVFSVPGLDDVRLKTVIETCQFLGAVQRFGNADRQDKTEDELADLADHGFRVARAGDPAVKKVLDDAIVRSGEKSLRGVFGRQTIGRLSALANEGHFTFLRNHLVNAAHRHRLYGRATEVMLGITVPKLTDWTLHEASAELHMAAQTLKDHLVAAGIVEKGETKGRIRLHDDQIGKIREVAMGLPGEGAAEHLGVTRATLYALHAEGLIVPALDRRSADDKPLPTYAKHDLDQLRVSILANCRSSVDKASVPIAIGAGHVGRSTATVLQLLLAGPQNWAFRNPSLPALSCIRVSVKALRQHVRLNETASGLAEAASQLGMDRTTFTSVVKSGHVAHHRGVNPVNLRRQKVVSQEEIRKFAERYVTVTALSARSAQVAKWMNAHLAERDVLFIGYPVRIYAWEDLERALAVGRFEGLVEKLTSEARDLARSSTLIR